MEPDSTARDAAMAPLGAFIGEWVIEARFPGGYGGTGRAVFEWTLDRQFLLCRTDVPGDAPDGLMVMGYDQGRPPYCQHYFDSRGVARVYAMDLSDGVWTLARDSADFTPLEFAQRYIGTFSADGQRIDGRWESAQDGGTWELDFHLNYIKVTWGAAGRGNPGRRASRVQPKIYTAERRRPYGKEGSRGGT